MQEFAQQVEDTIHEVMNDMHTAVPGVIIAYDPESGMADVEPVGMLIMADGKKLKYPMVSGVPVIFPQCQKAVIAYPVTEGDGCLLIICENDIKTWLTGEAEEAGDNRMKFDLTNAVCIPGLINTGSEAAKKAAEEEAIIIRNDEMDIMIKKDELSMSYRESSFFIKEKEVNLSCCGKRVRVSDAGIEIEGNLTVNGSISGK